MSAETLPPQDKTSLPGPRPELEGRAWVEDRRPSWQRLEERLEWLGASAGHWSRVEVEEFSADYRQAASDLLEARAGRASPAVAEYLNDLVGRAYMRLYTWSRPATTGAARFLHTGFPELVRQHWRYVLLSALVFFCGFALGFGRLLDNPQLRFFLLPTQHQLITPAERVEQDTDPVRRAAHVEHVATTSIPFATFLTLHNIRVALLAFALGIFGGVLTGAVLFTNGLAMGGLAADYYLAARDQALLPPGERGVDIWLFFWAWILPHGIPELMAVFIAGGGGFMLGRAAIAPGRLTTREALSRAAGPAAALLLGTLPLFFVAGAIEATISQLHPPAILLSWKLFMALMIALALGGYLAGFGELGGRPAPSEAGEDVWHRVREGGLLEILTPEHVVFRYRLAGWTTRAAALAFDLVWILVGALVLGGLLGVIFGVMPEFVGWTPYLLGFGLALALVTVGYFIALERPRTTTWGKRSLRLKVLDARGLGVSPGQRVLRNVVRVADLLPGFYLVGLVSTLLGRMRQRLGDRAAGTVVVEEGRAELPLTPDMEREWYLEALADRGRAIADDLTPDERDLLLQLATRRGRLSLVSRLRLTSRMAQYYERRTGWERPDGMPDERYLNGLAWAVLHREDARSAGGLTVVPQEEAPADERRRKRYSRRLRPKGGQR